MLTVLLALCATPDAELIKSLNAKWDDQRTAIKTARIRARAFRTGDVEPLSHSEVKAVFKSVDLANRPDDLRKLVFALWKHKEYPTDPWSIIEVSTDGDKLRERDASQGGMDYTVDKGITVVVMETANQTNILRTRDSRWVIRKPDDFRYVPQAGLTAPDLLPGFALTVAERKGGRVVLKRAAAPAEYEVDEETGFIHAYRCYDDTYTILHEVLQFGPGELPAAIARLRYKDGKLVFAHILVVEEVGLNIELPRDAFVVKAAQGALIVDARKPKEKVLRADHDIDNVISAFPDE
jgi:hypothetical protein